MEVKEKSKKRELIKTIAIIFLTVLLVLTFFSNTFMNRSLPEVATQSIGSGTINAKIRGSGTVSANEKYDVIINQTREVRSVCVKVGDTVEQGDLLFVLGDVESQELKDAQEQLQTLNINYQKQLLSLSKEYASEDRAVQKLQEELQKATEQRDANLVTEEEISFAKGDLAAAKSELSQIALVLEELNALMADNEEYQNAKTKVSELQSKITTLQNSIAEYQSQLQEIDTTGSVDMNRRVEAARAAMSDAQRTLSSNWMAYETSYRNLISDVQTEYKATNNVDISNIFEKITGDDGSFIITSDQQKYIDAYLTKYSSGTPAAENPYEPAYTALLSAYNDLQTKTTAYNNLVKDQSDANQSATVQQAAIQSKLNQANAELSNTNYQLQQANYALSQAEGSNSALKNQIKGYETAKRQQDALIETLNQTITDLEAKKTAYDAAVETIKAKEQALEDALSGKDIDKQLDDLDLQTMRLQIEKQQELVKKYTEEAVDTEIKAKVSGTISAINVSAGKDTTAGSPMASIDVVDRGYTIRIAVTNEQAKQVKVGDTADVTTYYWGSDITATLEAIVPDPDKPGQGKLLVFRITGDIDAGATISLSIGQRSTYSETMVPKSALRQDSNGYFVLVVIAKSSPLGNRYYATRADVQVLAEDDTNAAVTGLSAGDYVITTSSKPLEAGTMVRMVENP